MIRQKLWRPRYGSFARRLCILVRVCWQVNAELNIGGIISDWTHLPFFDSLPLQPFSKPNHQRFIEKSTRLGCDLWQTRPAEACALSSLESLHVHKDLLILSEWCEMLDAKQMQPMNTEILMDPYPISQTVSYFRDFPSFGCMCFHPLKS